MMSFVDAVFQEVEKRVNEDIELAITGSASRVVGADVPRLAIKLSVNLIALRKH